MRREGLLLGLHRLCALHWVDCYQGPLVYLWNRDGTLADRRGVVGLRELRTYGEGALARKDDLAAGELSLRQLEATVVDFIGMLC